MRHSGSGSGGGGGGGGGRSRSRSVWTTLDVRLTKLARNILLKFSNIHEIWNP
jgi:hypothetical protein